MAFSFACSDLFIEVNSDDQMSFASGAAKGLTGITDEELLELKWLDLFCFEDIHILTNLREECKPGSRIGPIIVHLSSRFNDRKAVFYGIKMPDDPSFYFTLGLSNDLLDRLGETENTAPIPSTPTKSAGYEFTRDEKPEAKKSTKTSDKKKPENLAKKLKKIIDASDYKIKFQPIINLESKELLYYEMLSSFAEGTTREWMDVAEKEGLSTAFDLNVLERAMNFIQFKAGATNNKFAVNISHLSLLDKTFIKELLKQTQKHPKEAGRLIFEITNFQQSPDIPTALLHIQALEQKGVNIAIDDFGDHADKDKQIADLNARYIKIDKALSDGIEGNTENQEHVAHIIQQCKSKNIAPIAKCIETQEQLDALIKIGIKHAQGHVISEITSQPSYIPTQW